MKQKQEFYFLSSGIILGLLTVGTFLLFLYTLYKAGPQENLTILQQALPVISIGLLSLLGLFVIHTRTSKQQHDLANQARVDNMMFKGLEACNQYVADTQASVEQLIAFHKRNFETNKWAKQNIDTAQLGMGYTNKLPLGFDTAQIMLHGFFEREATALRAYTQQHANYIKSWVVVDNLFEGSTELSTVDNLYMGLYNYSAEVDTGKLKEPKQYEQEVTTELKTKREAIFNGLEEFTTMYRKKYAKYLPPNQP